MNVHVSPSVSTVTPPMAVVLASTRMLYHVLSDFRDGRVGPAITMSSTRRALEHTCLQLNYSDFQIVCDVSVNLPEQLVTRKVTVLVFTKMERGVTSFVNRFRLWRGDEMGIIHMEILGTLGMPAPAAGGSAVAESGPSKA